jgi:hypothetical protein
MLTPHLLAPPEHSAKMVAARASIDLQCYVSISRQQIRFDDL